eukprot:m.213063 g.213063  ORF g.213063 m.213063 type:complete len:234 (+) comp13789_c0_seq1:1585-2286(+)
MGFKYNLRRDFSVQCISMLESIKKSSPSKQARADAQVALFEVDLREQQKEQQQRIRKLMADKHILLSCAPQFHKLAEEVKLNLEKRGHKCVIPEVSVSSFADMAETVEHACVVVPFVCKGYKESSECRALGEYAIALSKKIFVLQVDNQYEADGWVKGVVTKAQDTTPIAKTSISQACDLIFDMVYSPLHVYLIGCCCWCIVFGVFFKFVDSFLYCLLFVDIEGFGESGHCYQ